MITIVNEGYIGIESSTIGDLRKSLSKLPSYLIVNIISKEGNEYNVKIKGSRKLDLVAVRSRDAIDVADLRKAIENRDDSEEVNIKIRYTGSSGSQYYNSYEIGNLYTEGDTVYLTTLY